MINTLSPWERAGAERCGSRCACAHLDSVKDPCLRRGCGLQDRAPPTPVVLDTNIVLDVFVFSDAAAIPLRQALAAGTLDWLATRPMRDELARVLGYPKIVTRLVFYKLTAENVLAAFDQHARLVDVAAKCSLNCSDPDDQKFIDLAVAHQALLLSKDRAVISMAKRLLRQGIRVLSAM